MAKFGIYSGLEPLPTIQSKISRLAPQVIQCPHHAAKPHAHKKDFSTMTLEALNDSSPQYFVAVLGGIFEHSPWVAEEVLEQRPFTSLETLHQAMVAAVDRASEQKQLDLIRAHPDLAGKAALAGLTADSKQEQAGAGLNRLSEAEYKRFHELNAAYRERFGFPFIIAVKGHSKESILEAFAARLDNDYEAEKERALAEIAKIARFRLAALIEQS